MRKINIRPIIFSVGIILGSNSKTFAQSQSSDELFKKVFGKSSEAGKRQLIDATLGDFFIGEVNVVLSGEKIQQVSGSDLTRILSDKIREEKLVDYKIPEGDVSPEQLPFRITYHPSELRFSIQIPPGDLRPNDANVYDDLMPYYSRKATEPAPFLFSIAHHPSTLVLQL